MNKTVIIICGPTGIGKTALAIGAAQYFDTEIISADSRQCYKEMTIGVAKPDDAELAAAKHWFINSHSIHEEVNAAVFEDYALQKANEIFIKNDVVIMAGGTGMYIKAFCDGLDDMPSDLDYRNELNTLFEENGLDWLQNEVKQKDEIFWKTAEQQNPHRLIRALEVLHISGKSITEFKKQTKKQQPFDVIKIGLQTDKEILNERINKRVDMMMDAGLMDEIENLYPYKSLNALQTVGYSELFDYKDGKTSLSEAIERIKIHTRQYAKRQYTWFRKDKDVQWIDPNINALKTILEIN